MQKHKICVNLCVYTHTKNNPAHKYTWEHINTPPSHPQPPFPHTSTHRKTAAGVGNFAAVEVRAVEHPKVLAVNVYMFIFVCMFAYMYICKRICLCICICI